MNKHTIGTKWKDRNGRDCTVFDIYTTTSSAGCVVKEEYVSYHMFMGQRVEHIDNGVTIARGDARLQDSYWIGSRLVINVAAAEPIEPFKEKTADEIIADMRAAAYPKIAAPWE